MAAPTERKGGDLDFAADLFKAADKLRQNVEPSEYKHIALGLIFLKYVSDAFEAQRAKLAQDKLADPEDPDEYLAANVFWVPRAARWSNLQGKAKSAEIGKFIDDAMDAIERVPSNEKLEGALPRGYARPALNKTEVTLVMRPFASRTKVTCCRTVPPFSVTTRSSQKRVLEYVSVVVDPAPRNVPGLM